MIDKYFGFKTLINENSVIDSLVEHTRIDEEELALLNEMIDSLNSNNVSQLENCQTKISKIRSDSNRIFEYTEEHIIQAHFDFQKQYDLLRIYQRIEGISTAILNCSDHILILYRIEGQIPEICRPYLNHLIQLVIQNHDDFKLALIDYDSNKKNVLSVIHKITETEKRVNEHYFRCIEKLYGLANGGDLLMGHLRAVEKVFGSIEHLGNDIEVASTSLEWLLIN